MPQCDIDTCSLEFVPSICPVRSYWPTCKEIRLAHACCFWQTSTSGVSLERVRLAAQLMSVSARLVLPDNTSIGPRMAAASPPPTDALGPRNFDGWFTEVEAMWKGEVAVPSSLLWWDSVAAGVIQLVSSCDLH